jgi:hypothetical protein
MRRKLTKLKNELNDSAKLRKNIKMKSDMIIRMRLSTWKLIRSLFPALHKRESAANYFIRLAQEMKGGNMNNGRTSN